MVQDLIVLKASPARALLAKAQDAVDAKRVADFAHAAKIAHIRQGANGAAAECREIEVEALALMGHFIKAGPKATGTRGQLDGAGPGRGKTGSTKTEPPVSSTATQEEMFGKGGKKVAAEAQALAEVKETDPELYEKIKKGEKKPSHATRAVQRKKKAKKMKVRARAAAAAPANGEPLWQLIHGDTPAEMEKLRAAGERYRLVFNDGPYNQGVNYGRGKNADLLSDEDFLAQTWLWMQAVSPLLADDGSLWTLISHRYAADFETLLRKTGLHLRQRLIWYETFGVNHANGFNLCSRVLLWHVKNPKKFVFHGEAVNRTSDRQKQGDKRADPAGKTWDDVWGIDPPIHRLVDNAKERVAEFPTQLPLALLRPIVGCATDPGDAVLDLFAGSGTTLAAAAELGRKSVGIEREKKFVELARQRLLVLGDKS